MEYLRLSVNKFILFIFLSLVSFTSAYATEYFLNPATGNNVGPGTSEGGAWKTLQYAKSNIPAGPAAGHVLTILPGTYTPGQYKGVAGPVVWTQANARGIAGAPLKIRGKPGTTVTFDGNGENYWMQFATTGTAPTVDFYIIIENLRFIDYTSIVMNFYGAGRTSSDITYLQHITVQNCRFEDIRDGNSGNLASGYARYLIFRNNYSFNIGTFSGATPLSGPDHGHYPAQKTYHLVVENSHYEKIAGQGMQANAFHHDQDAGDYNQPMEQWIIRNNTIVNAAAYTILYGGCLCKNFHIYNNTLYQELNPFPTFTSGRGMLTNSFGQATWRDISVKNNIGYGTVSTSYAPLNLNFTDKIFNLQLDYNLWYNIANPSRSIKYKPFGGSDTWYTVAGFNAAFPAWEGHGKSANPLYNSAATRDFTLKAGSPAIDAGTTLTTAANTSSGTTLPVADAGYFHDGFGMVTGDSVVIGTQPAVLVTNVDYDSNTLTLAASRSWSTGTAVSLPYNGTAPDMGANESGVATLGTDLVAYYPFNENGGIAANDATGHEHLGTLVNGAGWSSAGVIGSGISLDGINDGVTIADHDDFTMTTGFSISAWIYATSLPSNEVKIVGQWDDVTINNSAWQLLLDGNNDLTIKTRNVSVTSFCTKTGSSIPLNTWLHVAGTYDGGTSGANCALYIAGIPVHSGTIAQLPNNSAVAVGIGTVANVVAGRTWPGRIDEVRIYKGRALSPEAIAALANFVPPIVPVVTSTGQVESLNLLGIGD